MPDRFYTENNLAVGDITLDGPEAHHLANVLRAKPGTRIVLFNGDGDDWHAEIVGVSKKQVAVAVLARFDVDRERPFKLTIAAAMPKGDRGDFMIEKLTELGATRFVPLITERTVVVPKQSRIESLRRTVIEASKQCGRNVLMDVNDPVKWLEFIKSNLPTTRILLHTVGAKPFERRTNDAVIAIGPEGGFTDTEAAIEGWTSMSLGPRVLRIETAAIIACH